jgi:hypothetical protein
MFQNARMQGQPLGAAQLAMLSLANQLMADQKPGEAAPLFAQLAGELQTSHHSRRAANLYARAAHAFATAHDGPAALVQARSALDLFLQLRMVYRAPMFYNNITRKLNNNNMKPAATKLEQEYGARMQGLPAAAAPRGLLPTNCPKCGAPIHGDDANWVDANTAECDYCGSLLRTA